MQLNGESNFKRLRSTHPLSIVSSSTVIALLQTFLSLVSGTASLGLMNLLSVMDLVASDLLLLRVSEIPEVD